MKFTIAVPEDINTVEFSINIDIDGDAEISANGVRLGSFSYQDGVFSRYIIGSCGRAKLPGFKFENNYIVVA